MGISNLIYDSWMKEAQYKKYSGIFPMLQRAGVDFQGKALDVGVGTGLFEDYLKGKGVQLDVSGIDIDEKMLREAKKKGYKVAKGTAEKLPFTDEAFDFLICLDTIHLVGKKDQALSEFMRVLKPGGFILLSHYCNTFTKTETVQTMESMLKDFNVIDKKLVGHSDGELAVVFLIKK